MSYTRSTASLTAGELIEKAARFDTDRRVRAMTELLNYRMLPGAVVNRESGEIYHPTRYGQRANGSEVFAERDCPDFTDRITKIRAAMTAASCGTACCCKHHYLRLLPSGQAVRVGNSVFTAKKTVK
jgi:hypothetical protein